MPTPRHSSSPTASDAVPKLCGADIELGNAILGLESRDDTCAEASQALLHEIRGYPGPAPARSQATAPVATAPAGWDSAAGVVVAAASSAAGRYDPQDWGRKFLPANGGCVYIDLDHLEVCLPEVRSAFDHLACWHAMLRIVREAQIAANARLPVGQRLSVLINNSDGHGHSYGSHTDFLVSRRCFDHLFAQKLHYALYLASYLTSSIVFTGAGKVGSENGQPPVAYQLSQRADFYEALAGPQTTYRRPLVNTRDESLCGRAFGYRRGLDAPRRRMARLHNIFFDNTLCHVSSVLKIGVTQLVLAMVEQDVVVPGLILDEPLSAVHAWSHDPTLRARAKLLSGRTCTALDMQAAFRDKVCWFVATGRADGIVPHAHQIVALWDETLGQLRAYQRKPARESLAPLARRLDWALKRLVLEHAIDQQGLEWDAPELKCLDHLYSSLDETDGLYWAYERAEVVERLVSPGQIERFVHQPPDDTRAWLRAHLLRRLDADGIVDVDWDELRVRFPDGVDPAWPTYTYWTVPLADPLCPQLDDLRPLLEGGASAAQAAAALEAYETDARGQRLRTVDDADEGVYLPTRVVPVGDGDLESPPLEEETPTEQGGQSHGATTEEE
ncbi:MAG: proteasome accessory factor PafA2 family protein [Planctomycetota bacterium]